MTLDSPQCPECLRLQMIENDAWVAWLEVKGLKPMTEAGMEKRNTALSASYATHFHRKKCPAVNQGTRQLVPNC
jgi:trans-aconitate methyltransferase